MNTVIGAVDVGGNKIAVGLVTEQGELLTSLQWKSDPAIEAPQAILPIAHKLSQLANKHNVTISAVGCSITGPVNPNKNILGENAFLPKWEGDVLFSTLTHELNVTVAMDNDAVASAMGEYRWGAGQGTNSFLFVCVGTGIGVAAILNGTPYRGVDGAHPECGHMVIDLNTAEEPCFCGARGCWESLASGTAMEKHWLKEQDSPLKSKDICELARSGNPKALQAVETEGNYLGVGIANLVTLFTPEVIALGGGVMGSYDLFIPYIQERVTQQCGLVPHQFVKIKPARFQEKAGLIGAAALVSLDDVPKQ